jgi:hypothetical protein
VENSRAVFRAVGARECSPGAQTARLQDVERGVKLSACSGCAGDYEDPDATSWTENFTGDLSDDEESEELTAPKQFLCSAKQVRKGGDGVRPAESGAVWEYRLRGVWRPATRRDWFSAPLLPPSPPFSTTGMTPAASLAPGS